MSADLTDARPWNPTAGIRKNGSGFQVRLTMPDGSRRSLGTYPTRQDAEKVRRATLVAIDQGTWVDPDEQARQQAAKQAATLAALADRWFLHPPKPRKGKRPRRPSTVAEQRRIYDKRIAPVLGQTPVTSLTVPVLQQWADGLRADRLAQQTLANVAAVLNNLLDMAVRLGTLTENPLARVDFTSDAPDPEPMVVLAVSQVDNLCSALDSLLAAWNQAMIGMPGRKAAHRGFDPALVVRTATYVGGLRSGEVTGLRVADLDVTAGTLTVARAVRRGVEQAPKTAAGNRTVAVPASLLPALAAHVDGRDPAERLFTSPEGSDFDGANYLRRWFRPAAKMAGLPVRVRFHDLRHTGISLLLAAGVPPTDVAKWAGHANPAVTLTTYAHAVPGREDVPAKALDGLLAAPRLRAVA